MTTDEAFNAGYDDGQCDRYSRALDFPKGRIRAAYLDGYSVARCRSEDYGECDRTFEIYGG